MRVVVIDDQIKARISRLVKYAESHPYTMDDLLDIKNNQKQAPGDLEEHVVIIPMGVRAVFTIDEQNVGRCRHLSLSVDSGKLPNPLVVEELLPLFGFTKAMENCILNIGTGPIPNIDIVETPE